MVDREAAPTCRQGGSSGRSHQALVQASEPNDVSHADDRQSKTTRNSFQILPPGHCAVVAHDLADAARGRDAGKTAEIHGRFRMSPAHQDTPRAGNDREYVPGPRQVFRPALCICQSSKRGGAIRRGNSGGRAADPIDALGEGRAVQRSSLLADLNSQVETLRDRGIYCAADQAAGLPRHQVDVAFGGVHCCHHEVSLPFAIRVVRHDDHVSPAQLFDRALDRALDSVRPCVRPTRLRCAHEYPQAAQLLETYA